MTTYVLTTTLIAGNNFVAMGNSAKLVSTLAAGDNTVSFNPYPTRPSSGQLWPRGK